MGCFVSNASAMRQTAKSNISAFKPAVVNFLRTKASLNVLKSKSQIFVQGLKNIDKNKVKLGAVLVGNIAAAGYGLYTMYRPEFTVENINKYGEKYLGYFAQQAIENILSLDIDKARAIDYRRAREYLLERYPDHVTAAITASKDSLSLDQFEGLYRSVFNRAVCRQIKNVAIAKFGKRDPSSLNRDGGAVSQVLFEPIPNPQTISDHHYNENLYSVVAIFRNESFKHSHVKDMFMQAYAQQKEEQEKGNYLFYHGRSSEWEFFADMYKQAYNIVNPHKKVGDDYVFLRFNKTKMFNFDKGKDVLWMNAALYGNATRSSSCTAEYVLDNFDQASHFRGQCISLEMIYAQLGLQKEYCAYSKELEALHELFVAAYPGKKMGNLLAVSIPEKELSRVKFLSRYYNQEGTGDTLIKNKKIEDIDTFILPLTKDYVLDPYKGPRIYSYSMADPVKLEEYKKQRDQLFEKIRADREKNARNGFIGWFGF